LVLFIPSLFLRVILTTVSHPFAQEPGIAPDVEVKLEEHGERHCSVGLIDARKLSLPERGNPVMLESLHHPSLLFPIQIACLWQWSPGQPVKLRLRDYSIINAIIANIFLCMVLHKDLFSISFE
jgi:hypothetical protein